MKSAYITGISGYIGSQLAHYLITNGWIVSGLIREASDLSNLTDIQNKVTLDKYEGIESLLSSFKRNTPDVVFHLASMVKNVHCSQDVNKMIDSNVKLGTELLETMKNSGCRLFVNTGSYWQNYNSEDFNPVNLYASTKEAFEKILKYYTEVEGIRAITLRLFDVYGAKDPRPKIWNIIKTKAGSGEELILSPGEQELDMVYITDVCAAYEQSYFLLTKHLDLNNAVYGVYTNNRKSLKDIVECFKALLNNSVLIRYGGKPYKDREIMIPNNSLEILPGWHPQVSLEEGFKLMISNT